MNNLVSLVQTQNSRELKDSIAEALNLIGFKPPNNVKTVAIKVNLCYYWKASTGYTTDPLMVSNLIDYIRESYRNNVEIKVVEADATAMRTKYAFKILGYEKLAKEKKVELINLSEDVIEEKKIQVRDRNITYKVPQLLLKSDLFINMPKLKLMRATHISCALKNIFGGIASSRKIVYHSFLSEAIVGINKILRPHLTLVDGLTALGRFPAKLDLILAGMNPFYVDCVASQIVGYSPGKVESLRLAQREGFGDMRKIEVVGADIEVFKRRFPRVNKFLLSHSWKLQFRLLKLYNTIVGDVIPPALETA
ncbi:MAG: DUF362 domain-containing protein [Candidatus Bathyarchaeota archaeon]|jgi:uncharacterized protein (DUF362 family)